MAREGHGSVQWGGSRSTPGRPTRTSRPTPGSTCPPIPAPSPVPAGPGGETGAPWAAPPRQPRLVSANGHVGPADKRRKCPFAPCWFCAGRRFAKEQRIRPASTVSISLASFPCCGQATVLARKRLTSARTDHGSDGLGHPVCRDRVRAPNPPTKPHADTRRTSPFS